MTISITFEGAELSDPEKSLGREWLLTNGLGGYSSSSLVGANTRRYHGLLVAAVNPPVQRMVLLSKVEEEVILNNQSYFLGVNEWGSGVIDPHGYQYLSKVTLDGASIEFVFTLPGCRLFKTILMPHGLNVVYIDYRFEGTLPGGIAELKIRPFLCSKDYHSEQKGGLGQNWRVDNHEGIFSYQANEGSPCLSFMGDNDQRWQASWLGDWYWNYFHRAEKERGQDCTEDLFCPQVFGTFLHSGENGGMVWWHGGSTLSERPLRSSLTAGAALRKRLNNLEKSGGFEGRNPNCKLLFQAAGQFVVVRPSVRKLLPQGVPDRSLIAGYHWFSDWGRDTMISFPGLFLSTGRFEEAQGVLRTFAAYLDQGMLPNRFPDSGETPEYNTVDATLWFFQAIYAYYLAVDELEFIKEIFPALNEVIEWHKKGTRYGIKVDPVDGLLISGVSGVQLTWMDAKVGDLVVTPRAGKAVEINALWLNALEIMAIFAEKLKLDREADGFRELVGRVKNSFHQKFWFEEGGYLYDVIDSQDPPNPMISGEGLDRSIRPNQLISLSLPFGPFETLNEKLLKRAKSILSICENKLLTPFGMRTLDPADPRYIGKFTGDQYSRDTAYHQGTVWPWLIGPYLEAHFRIFQKKDLTNQFLEPLLGQLREGGLGSINEVFDGDPPHRPLGCIAQAWSVAEVLRIYLMVN